MEGRHREPRRGDAFGAALLDALAGGSGNHVVERDDGLVEVMDASMYFAGTGEWPQRDTAALDLVAGRVLDVGAGAGRHALALQQRGHQVVALDYSAGAIEVCQNRGVENTFHGTLTALVDAGTGPFDAALLMGHNLGILGSVEGSRVVFDALRSLLGPGGVVVGSCLDPATDDAVHLAYHRWNVERGRLAGQTRLRVRFRELAGAWFDWLFASTDQLGELALRSGWHLAEATEPDPTYLAMLRPG